MHLKLQKTCLASILICFFCTLVSADMASAAAVAAAGEQRILDPHLRTCRPGQDIQHPLHDDVVPHERQPRVILYDGRYQPSVQDVQESRAAAAAVEERQPHPAARAEKRHSGNEESVRNGRRHGAVSEHLHEINDSSPPPPPPFCAALMKWVFTMQLLFHLSAPGGFFL